MDQQISKQQRIQVWRDEVAASALTCTCPPMSPAASSSSTNISLSSSTVSSPGSGGGGGGDVFTFPRGGGGADIHPSPPAPLCQTCSRLGAPSAMGLEPNSPGYLDDVQHSALLQSGGFDRRGSMLLFRTKHANHAIFRGVRNLVRRISGSSSNNNNNNNINSGSAHPHIRERPLPPRGAEEAMRARTSMYQRRATVNGMAGVLANMAAEEEEAQAMAELESEGRGHVPKLIAEKQARLRRASRLLMRSHHEI
ncbi:hypothetical protein C8035_v012079 [Colletotrichum spinosum]|uniref:Uncharacterized protein n=1 Tax=Colletotrichum spinosum TaxID=1347390 RepID=A0A4R8PSP1_9PEZI|nr:hypothetical protein C8035_v012079 [Colletotrichum spinosum]